MVCVPMRLRWLNLALDDLDEIAAHISQDNPKAARRMVERLWKAAIALIDQSDMGRPGRVHGTRELVVGNTPFIVPYRVVYSLANSVTPIFAK